MTNRVPVALRWLRFNLVGLLGVGVQLTALAALVSVAEMEYLPASALAVEITILHNFAWHERYTWADRHNPRLRARLWRLVKFHLSNGAVSLVGNLALMRLLVGELAVPVIAANLLAIAVCSTVNYLFGELLVFRSSAAARQERNQLCGTG